jgi:hypothetical protein
VRVALNDDDTRAYLLADNRISELGTYDSDALGRLLIEVDGSDIGLEGTGYRPEELKRFLSLLDADPADRADQVRCPRCGAHVKA